MVHVQPPHSEMRRARGGPPASYAPRRSVAEALNLADRALLCSMKLPERLVKVVAIRQLLKRVVGQ